MLTATLGYQPFPAWESRRHHAESMLNRWAAVLDSEAYGVQGRGYDQT